jgi:hypothetical protein
MKNRVMLLMVILMILVLASGQSWAYRVMPSLNTYNKELIKDALARVVELKCNGVWFITQNSDLADSEWQTVFNTLGGHDISEDNPGQNRSYVDYLRIVKKAPACSLCYNETGGLPGGTLLSEKQIQAQYRSHGNHPIICLTRVFLVYQNYHQSTKAWYGPGGVKEAIRQACEMPNYTPKGVTH